MTDDKLLDTVLPFPLMYRADEHPNAFRMMIDGKTRVPQVLRLWMNFDACYEIHSKLLRGVIFMEKGEAGIYSIELPAWKMHAGYEPKLTESQVSKLVVPGGASAAGVMEEEKRKEGEEGENA